MKQYNGEKAIISLTSWKARISTVSKTLYSLLTMCPEFHIVLVLSEEEFPKKEAELPVDVAELAAQDIIEILWVYKNYKAFKKVLFTSAKYPNVPVISADDDMIYTCNYADELYKVWLDHPNSCVAMTGRNEHLWGYALLHIPNFAKYFNINKLDDIINKNCIDDDMLYTEIRKKNSIGAIPLHRTMYGVCWSGCNKNSISQQRLTHKQNDKKIFEQYL